MDSKSRVDPPGWNDPPMLNYNATNPPPKSRITNRRVPFPLNPTSSSPRNVPHELQIISEEMFKDTKNNLRVSFKDNEALERFCRDWEGGKLNEEAKRTAYLLGQCIKNGNKSEAELMKLKLLNLYEDCKLWCNYIQI